MFLLSDLVVEETAGTYAARNSICMQRESKLVAAEKVEPVQLLLIEQVKRRNSAVIEQPQKDASAVTMEEIKTVGHLKMLLKQAVREISELKKEREAATLERGELCKGMERVESERD